ncbi:MAG: 2-oxoacid:acceptor oxidoreductase family protein [Candidatus Moduliflexus flocculans]|nr:2-oxoacid:acceptor oxidoreductase family protein [Candidatus Moduliflexus flocculans]
MKAEPKRKDCRVIKVPCNEIAESIGDVKIANMVMMGALSKVTGAVKLDKLEPVLKSFFPPTKHKFIEMNLKAIEAGKAAV